MSRILEVLDSNFEEIVGKAGKPVLVDFWAPWCGHCTRLAPVLTEIAEELNENVLVAKVNVDENRQLASKFNVMSLPTMIFFKQGEIVERLTGFMPKSAIISKLNHSFSL